MRGQKFPTIFILEDEIDLAEMVAMEMENQGYVVQTFYNPKSFLENITQNLPDVVITDIRLPEISGKEVITLLKKSNPFIPAVIVITAFEDYPFPLLYHLGAEAVLSKPFELSQISSTVKRLTIPYNERYNKDGCSDIQIPEWILELTENDMDEIILGRGGYSFYSTQHLSVGEKVHFRFHYLDKEPLIMEGLGIVRWMIPSYQTGKMNKYGVEIVYLYDTIKYTQWVQQQNIIPYIPLDF